MNYVQLFDFNINMYYPDIQEFEKLYSADNTVLIVTFAL